MLSPEKTCVTHIDEGFDFLGQHLRKYGGKLLVTPSRKNAHVLGQGAADHPSQGAESQANLIHALNRVILRGWAFYHRHVAAKRTFKKVEWALAQPPAVG